MAEQFRVAIVGSGPGGLSAAARAAVRDQEAGTSPSHVLLEGYELPAKTIQRYQLGKHVMAQPGFLDLRSDCRFEEGKREAILGAWEEISPAWVSTFVTPARWWRSRAQGRVLDRARSR